MSARMRSSGYFRWPWMEQVLVTCISPWFRELFTFQLTKSWPGSSSCTTRTRTERSCRKRWRTSSSSSAGLLRRLRWTPSKNIVIVIIIIIFVVNFIVIVIDQGGPLQEARQARRRGTQEEGRNTLSLVTFNFLQRFEEIGMANVLLTGRFSHCHCHCRFSQGLAIGETERKGDEEGPRGHVWRKEQGQ